MKRPSLAAAGTAALTSLLFIVLYNLCNYFTALRPDVGVWVFGWEKHWPLIPAMIVPYWSIDALFVVAPFLCTSREELRVYRQRMFFAIGAAALCYLAIPLQFAFARPQVDGAFGPWFSALHGVDLPHNLFPSLHITLRTLLAAVFLRKTRGAANWAAQGWFSLVGISTLLTWQHHLVDVLGGFWLAAIAMHLYRFDERTEPHLPNRRVAIYYAVAALVCSQLARLSWPWTFPLVWPAFACGVAALPTAAGVQ
jgi:membrane-associated phospholipid phosphatase